MLYIVSNVILREQKDIGKDADEDTKQVNLFHF
jgi:hypothetical protein